MVTAHFEIRGSDQGEDLTRIFITEQHIFGIIEFEGKEPDLADKIKGAFQQLDANNVHALADFEKEIDTLLKKVNAPVGVSLGTGLVKDGILYVKTIGDTAIFLRRGSQTEKLIDGEKSASGFIRENDCMIFASQLFVSFLTEETITKEKDFKDKFNFRFIQRDGKRKKITLVITAIILLVLVWSVGLGYERRKKSEQDKTITMSRALITEKLNQAEEVAFLNQARAQVLVDESKKEVETIKKKYPERKEDIDSLSKLVQEKESSIFKREEKKAEEFFDLTVDNEEAGGSVMDRDEDVLAILDSPNGVVRLLSLSKKSLEKETVSEAKSASLTSLYQGKIYVFIPKAGIVEIKESKAKKVIEADKEWGEIVDMKIYGGNIYLLDSRTNQVYKYIVVENGFSDRSSYFKESLPDLTGARSMAIDGSVYLQLPEKILKYTGGVKDAFSTSFPETDIGLEKVMTSKDLDKVYAWDKKKGLIYILSKEGAYEREIKSSILTKAESVSVFENIAYVLEGAKIYKISLE